MQEVASRLFSPSQRVRLPTPLQHSGVEVTSQRCILEYSRSVAATEIASSAGAVSSSQYLGESGRLTSSQIRNNLASARRALRSMQENDL